jgi:alpha-N-arabinofuranosidase
MSSQFGYFDNYTNEHPLLLGEYAVIEYDIPGFSAPQWNNGSGRAYFPFWYGSVAEAIYLLSAERNADKIIGADYAPTFMNLNKWEWIPDLIAYDANPANTILSTSYHVIELLSNTRITENLQTTGGDYDPADWVAGRSAVTGSHIVKAVVYNATQPVPFDVTFAGVGQGAEATLTWLTAPKNSSNTIGNDVVQKTTSQVSANRRGCFSFTLPEYSVAVLEVHAATTGCDKLENRAGWLTWADWIPGKGYSADWDQWGAGWPSY